MKAKQLLNKQTYPSWTGIRELVEWLGQQDFGITHGVADRVVLLLPGEGELREGCLVAWCVLDVDEVLVVWDAVIFR